MVVSVGWNRNERHVGHDLQIVNPSDDFGSHLNDNIKGHSLRLWRVRTYLTKG